MVKTLAAACIALALVASAHAQNWTSQQFGGQTYYHSNDGWNGTSSQFGGQTFSHFNGPMGQQLNCQASQFGGQTFTHCN